MSFSTLFQTSEADVLKAIVKIKNGITFADHEIIAGFKWLEGHAGDIAVAVATVAQVVGTLSGAGVTIPPSVVQAVKDANVAVAALNAMTSNQEKGTPQALIDGYVAAKTAWKAADGAGIAIAMAPQVN